MGARSFVRTRIETAGPADPERLPFSVTRELVRIPHEGEGQYAASRCGENRYLEFQRVVERIDNIQNQCRSRPWWKPHIPCFRHFELSLISQFTTSGFVI